MPILPLLYDMFKIPLERVTSRQAHSTNFGSGLHSHDLHSLTSGPIARHSALKHWPYRRPWVTKRHRANQESSLATTTITKDGFQVCLDVEHFAPNEITVKTVDRTIIIEGKHEEKEDEDGNVYRHFVRRYTLPKGFDISDVIATVSSDGILTIKAPPQTDAKSNERVIQIQQTGPAHLSIPPNTQENANSQETMTE